MKIRAPKKIKHRVFRISSFHQATMLAPLKKLGQSFGPGVSGRRQLRLGFSRSLANTRPDCRKAFAYDRDLTPRVRDGAPSAVESHAESGSCHTLRHPSRPSFMLRS